MKSAIEYYFDVITPHALNVDLGNCMQPIGYKMSIFFESHAPFLLNSLHARI